MRRIISVLTENESGALSRLTLVTYGDQAVMEQIMKQLNKLIDVLKVSDLTDGSHIERELLLIKVKASGFVRAEVKRTSDIFRGQIIDVTDSLYTVQLSGDSDKLDAFIETLSGSTEIVEVVRSGVCGIGRGERCLKV